jgi:acyl-CoA reductase-like NAD-dependent aldehyde dehydrogenase
MEVVMQDFGMLIGGRLTKGAGTFDVINPATENVLAAAPFASPAQLDEAVAAANAAFPAWAATPIEERRAALSRMADRLDEYRDELAHLLTQEQGKPLEASRREIAFAAFMTRQHAKYDLDKELRQDLPDQRTEIHRIPLGVVGAIVPWNFPILLFFYKVPFALLAGNTVVAKPAPTTPLTTLFMGELFSDLLPPGVLNVVGDRGDLGPLLTSHPGIHKIAFTGSTATGRKVMASAAATLKRLSLELGGNDAAIVLDDADPKAISPALYAAAFANSGQVCIALKRLYVHETIYDAVCTELARLADETVVGDGLEQGTMQGPLQNKAQFERVLSVLDEARTKGRVVAGGTRPDGPGYFLRPTIVRDIAEGSRLVDEEQFGPILPVIKFSSVDDAIQRANALPFGLGGSVWSKSSERAYGVALRMNAGMVWVNQHLRVDPDVPFGGAGQSGFGSELGREGLEAFTQVKVVSVRV